MKNFWMIMTGAILTALFATGCGIDAKILERYSMADHDPAPEEQWVFEDPELPSESEEIDSEEFAAEEEPENSGKELKTDDANATAAMDRLDFALKIYREIAGEEKGNLIISPYSMEMAFAMLYWGARNESAAEIAQLFNFKLTNDGMPGVLNGSQDAIPGITLNVANAVWMEKSFSILPQYTADIKRYFKGAAYSADFVNRADMERTKINRWVAYQTRNKIKNFFPEGSISSDAIMVLVNAVYFQADWMSPFDSELTSEQPFWSTPDDSTQIPMLQGKKSALYFEDDEAQIASILYKNPRTSMVILLPKSKEANALNDFSSSLTAEKLNAYINSLERKEVALTIPKFKIDRSIDLKPVLKKLGMTRSFDKDANFSGITGKPNVFVSSAIHQAIIEVNEKGTEAAAATGIGIALMSLPIEPPKEFCADRPFIFAVYSDAAGVLFVGRFTGTE